MITPAQWRPVRQQPATHLGLTSELVIEAFLNGLCIAILSALSPAREAASTTAAEAMARGRAEYENPH
jgi:hypothetical protein